MDIFCSVRAALRLPGSLVYQRIITQPRGAQVEKTAIQALSESSTKAFVWIPNKNPDLKQGEWSHLYYTSTVDCDVSSLLMCCGKPWVSEQSYLANTICQKDVIERYSTQKKNSPSTDLRDKVQIHYSSLRVFSIIKFTITMVHYHSE